MKKAVIIGGRGKIGSYLVPLLVEAGYAVISVSRGKTEPYVKHDAWNKVETVLLDRKQPGFEDAIAALCPDIVVDMICFTDADMRALITKLQGKVQHYIAIGSMWMHGHSTVVPVMEHECRAPLGEYGIQKSAMDYTVAELYASCGFPGTVVHPGHIVCPGDVPINPQGCKSLEAFYKLRDGELLTLPNLGMETLHHVHASDVAGVVFAAIRAGEKAFGQGFHAVSPRAVTLWGYAQEAATWYGKTADLICKPFPEWAKDMSEKDAAATLEHISHSPNGSMQKVRDILGYEPKFTTYEAIRDCLKSFDL